MTTSLTYPAIAYAQHRLARPRIHGLTPPAFQLLFRSGNPPPPNEFAGAVALGQFVNRRRFRAALWMHAVSLYCNADGTCSRLEFIPEGKVGYTPIVLPDATRYAPGYGSMSYEVTLREQSATATLWIRFKVSRLTDLTARAVTGRWAASAWMRIDYTINTEGQTTVDFSGSHIPSQDYFVDWRAVPGHDMMRNAPLEIDGFLEAGRCVDAPGALRHRWI